MALRIANQLEDLKRDSSATHSVSPQHWSKENKPCKSPISVGILCALVNGMAEKTSSKLELLSM